MRGTRIKEFVCVGGGVFRRDKESGAVCTKGRERTGDFFVKTVFCKDKGSGKRK